MIKEETLKKLIYIDIETVSEYPNFSDLPENMKKCWMKKHDKPENAEIGMDILYRAKAALYPEFAKIVCISVGIFKITKSQQPFSNFLTFSFFDSFGSSVLFPDPEKEHSVDISNENYLLSKFFEFIKKREPVMLCGHNIKSFDIPFITKRAIIHGLTPPSALDNAGKKPWELTHLVDSMEVWSQGVFGQNISLDLLCNVLNIKSPKSDISGENIGPLYHSINKEANNKVLMEGIVNYCEGDVIAVMQVMRKISGLGLYPTANIESKTIFES